MKGTVCGITSIHMFSNCYFKSTPRQDVTQCWVNNLKLFDFIPKTLLFRNRVPPTHLKTYQIVWDRMAEFGGSINSLFFRAICKLV